MVVRLVVQTPDVAFQAGGQERRLFRVARRVRDSLIRIARLGGLGPMKTETTPTATARIGEAAVPQDVRSGSMT
jgi:hypothetical protein